MIPIIAIVGRPNVGKSTLFNRLSGRRKAIVDDTPGVTRDRIYARASWKGRDFMVVDTGGFDPQSASPFWPGIRKQLGLAIEEAQAVIFMGDAKNGLVPQDAEIMGNLRKFSKPLYLTVNKVDGPKQEAGLEEFFHLGLEKVYPISALHGRGLGDLMEDLLEAFPAPESQDMPLEEGRIQISVIGRPNVGKSSIVNRLIGRPRMMVSELPGTTRDAVDTEIQWKGKTFILVDTAGIRRKGRIEAEVEHYSILRALKSLERAQVVMLVLDVSEGLTAQDLHLAGYAHEEGRALLVLANKWDLLKGRPDQQKKIKEDLAQGLKFMPYAPVLFISALTGTGVARIWKEVEVVYAQFQTRVETGPLNRILKTILARHAPPRVGLYPLKIYYGTQTRIKPPGFVLFANQEKGIHFSYQRYLVNQLHAELGLDKTPIRLYIRKRKA